MYVCRNKYICMMYECMSCMYVCIVCMYVVCMYVCMYMCVCILINTHIHEASHMHTSYIHTYIIFIL